MSRSICNQKTTQCYCIEIYLASNTSPQSSIISIDEFKKQLDIKTGKLIIDDSGKASSENKHPTFLEFLDIELKEMKDHGMRQTSWKGFNRHANILKKFSQEVRPFDYEDIDWNFRLELIDWLTLRNDKLAYGNKTLSVLRQFMERARRKKFHSNTDYQGSGWMVPKKKAVGQKVILTTDELQTLADL